MMNEPNRQNGYKDPDQSVLDFALIECDATFNDVADPARGALWLARDYRKTYTAARNSSIAATALGGLTVAGALALSLPLTSPLVAAGLLGTAIGGLMIGRHASGASNAESECKFLETHPELPKALAHAVGQGLTKELAVSVYQQWLNIHSTGRTLTASDIQRTFAESTNAAIEGYKLGQQSATAFTTGELVQLPDYATTAVEDEPEADDLAPVEAPAYQLAVPAFLRDAQSPKSSGVAVQTSPIAAPTQTAILPRVQAPLLSRITKVGGFLPSRLFIGASRTGKSQVASDALSQVRKDYPEASIYYISAGFKETEDGWYWAAANHVGGYALKDMKPEAVRGAYEHWASLIEAFRDNADYSSAKPKVLVVDELDSIMAFAEGAGNSGKHVVTLLINTLTAASSTGAKDGFIMWALAPVGDCAGLGLTRGKVSAMNPVFVAFNGQEWNEATYKTAAANGLAPATRPQGFREGDRVIGIGGNWELLPPSPKLARSIDDCRFYPPSGMDLVMDAIAAQTIAQIAEPEPVDELTQQMRAVYEYAAKKGQPFDKRTIQRGNLGALKGMSSDDIGTLLELMAEDDYLTVQDGFYYYNPNRHP